MKKIILVIIFSLGTLIAMGQITIIRPDTIDPTNMHVVNGKLLYYHNSRSGVWEHELWATDGTNAGSYRVKDINPNSTNDLFNWYSSCGAQRYFSYVFKDELYFLADDGTHGMEIWKSNGTSVGTNMLLDLNPGLTGWDFTDCKTPGFCECNGTLYFSAGDSTNGYELWKTDSSASGTMEVKDIFPGATGSNPHFLTSFNGKIFFTAKDDTHGWELFCSDGTALGTTIVKDIVPGINGAFNDGTDNSTNPQFKVSGNYLYFQADNNGITPVAGHWWRTDGTDVGTIQLETTLTAQSTGPYGLVVTTADLNGQFIFIASGGATPSKFWKSDGSPSGTVEVSLNSGLQMRPSILSLGNNVYFNGMDNDSSGLALSDGSTSGSQMVFGYVEAGASFNVASQVNFNGNMFFHITKYYGTMGAHERLTQTNGTRTGTIIYRDVEPLSPVVPFGNDLIFYGHDTTEASPQYTRLYRMHPAVIPPAIGVGTEDDLQNNYSIEAYPNPASSRITLKSSEFLLADAEVSLMDVTGRIIAKTKFENNPFSERTMEIPLGVSDGLYFLLIRNKSAESKTISVIIQR